MCIRDSVHRHLQRGEVGRERRQQPPCRGRRLPARIGANITTATLPEGRLRLRVSATTAGGTQVVTRSLLVDRTRPRATKLSYRRGVLRGTLSERATVAVGGVGKSFPRGRFALRVRVLRTLVVTDVAGNTRRIAHP